MGATGEGDEVDSCGTAEAIVRSIPAYLKDEQVRDLAHAGITTDWSIQPGRWSLLAGTEGGLAMQRVLNAIGVDKDGLTALDAAALTRLKGGFVSRVLALMRFICEPRRWRHAG